MRRTSLALATLAQIATLAQMIVVSFSATALAADPAAVDFFDARAAGDLDAKFIAVNEKRGHLLLKNHGQQPLKIRMPAAFAGVPVLAQFDPIPFPPEPAQPLGIPGQVGLNERQLFNVAPENLVELKPGQKRTIRIKSVCLDHGKPTPNARMKYDVVPMADYNSSAELAELMVVYGQGKYSQPAVQAMAWHYANSKTIDELRTLRHKNTKQRIFTTAQIDEAVRLDQEVRAQTKQREQSVSTTTRVAIRR
jgi:hypothetical protein